MNLFAKAWDMLVKALDPNNFNLDDLIGREPLPFNDRTAFNYLQADPLGEFAALRRKRIDADLDMGAKDIAPWKPTSMAAHRDEIRAALGGGFSSPGKMHNDTYSLPTHMCMRGGVLREVPGSVCEHCYAHGVEGTSQGGKYPLNNVQRHLLRNYVALKNDPQRWASALVHQIPKRQDLLPIFRWHDSGDLDSPEHLAYLMAIAESRPESAFWLPTREWDITNKVVQARGGLPPNMALRLSIPMVDQTIDNEINEQRGVPLLPQRHIDMLEQFPQLGTSSVVSRPDYALSPNDICAATDKTKKGGKCIDHECTACWEPEIRNIDYVDHY